MIEDPKAGDRVWVVIGGWTIMEGTISELEEYPGWKKTLAKLHFNNGEHSYFNISRCSFSKESLLQHLSDTAMPLQAEGEPKA